MWSKVDLDDRNNVLLRRDRYSRPPLATEIAVCPRAVFPAAAQ